MGICYLILSFAQINNCVVCLYFYFPDIYTPSKADFFTDSNAPSLLPMQSKLTKI